MRSPQSMMPGRISYRAWAKRWIAIRPVPLVWQSVSALERAASQPSVGRPNLRRPKCLSGTLRAQGQKLSSWDASRTPPNGPAARSVPTGIAFGTAVRPALRANHLTVLVTRLHFSGRSPSWCLAHFRPALLDQARSPQVFPHPHRRGQAPMFRSGRCKSTRRSRPFWRNSLWQALHRLRDSRWYDACSSSPQPARPADEGSL